MASEAKILLKIQPTPWLEQISGPGRGRVFEIDESRLAIGRSDENQIVILDESVSRVHAVLEKGDDGSVVIFDNQSRNGILVNNRKVDASALNEGDIVQIGVVSFRVSIPIARSIGLEEKQSDGKSELDFPGNSVAAPKRAPNKRVLLYGGLAVIIAAVFLMNGESKDSGDENKKKIGPEANTTVSVSPEPETLSVTGPENQLLTDPTKNPVESELENLPWADSGLTESEAYFRRGQRDYFNKNYHRAISSFELALSLNKNHASAKYYLAAAIHDAEEEAKKNFEMGLKYFEALQYRRAIYHFQQTQALLSHKPQEKITTESERYIKLARQRLQAAELFP
jgi:pSer/pThr/pTyr-binding forkhead associated (FHA) protein